MEQPLVDRVHQIRRFFQFASAKEWALAGSVPADLAPDRYKTETLRMQMESAEVVEALVDGGEADTLRQLLQGARTELLVPVVEVLARRKYQPSAEWLTREYRGRHPQTRLALLEYFSQVPTPSAFAVVWEDLNAKSSIVSAAAGEALASIRNAVPELAFLSAAMAGEQLPEEPPQPEQVVQALVRVMPLEPALQALAALRSRAPAVYSDRVYRALHTTADQEGTGDEEGDTQRALLLLASQDWELSSAEERLCGIAFHRSGQEERHLLLRTMTTRAAVRVLAQGLSPTGRKLLDQTLAHLEHDRPDLVPHLAPQMALLARRVETPLQVRLLLVMNSHLPAEAPLRQEIPRQLVTIMRVAGARPYRGQIVAALLSSEHGRALMANERLDGQVWEAVREASGTPGRASELKSLVTLVADAVSSWAVLDTSRLDWLLRMIEDDSLLTEPVQNALARAVSAHLLFAPDPVCDALLGALGRQKQRLSGIWPQILRCAAAMPCDRQERVLDLTLHLPDAHRILGEAILAARAVDRALRNGFVSSIERHPDGAAVWLQSHPGGPELMERLREWVTEATGELRQDGAEQSSLERQRRQTVAAAGVPLLEDLGAAVDSLMAAGYTEGSVVREYLLELEDGLFSLAEGEPDPVPVPISTGQPVTDALSLQVMARTLGSRKAHWKDGLAAEVGRSCGLALEKLALAISRVSPEQKEPFIVSILRWLEAVDLIPVEPAPGAVVPFKSERHGLWGAQAGAVITNVVVLTLGMALPDGTVLRKALVSPQSTSGR